MVTRNGPLYGLNLLNSMMSAYLDNKLTKVPPQVIGNILQVDILKVHLCIVTLCKLIPTTYAGKLFVIKVFIAIMGKQVLVFNEFFGTCGTVFAFFMHRFLVFL